MTMNPPRWAEAVLRLTLSPVDRDPVSGDLREEYVDVVRPQRGRFRADVWYVKHVTGFVWRANGAWAMLVSAAFVSRAALDWLQPTSDFHQRSVVSTSVCAALLLAAGVSLALRTRDVRSGPLAAAAAALIAAPISSAGSLALLAIWHDAGTRAAIAASGGLAEALTLPFVLVVPAVICGLAGGVLGRAAAAGRV